MAQRKFMSESNAKSYADSKGVSYNDVRDDEQTSANFTVRFDGSKSSGGVPPCSKDYDHSDFDNHLAEEQADGEEY